MNMRIAMLAMFVGCSSKTDGKGGNLNSVSSSDSAESTLDIEADTGEEDCAEDSRTPDTGSDTGMKDTDNVPFPKVPHPEDLGPFCPDPGCGPDGRPT